MSRKRKKGKDKRRKAVKLFHRKKKEDKVGTKSIYKACTHPLWVTIGKHRVLLCSSCDYDGDVAEVVKGLDVFIGLDQYRWDVEEVKDTRFKNPLLQRIWERYRSDKGRPENIIALHVPDRGVNERVYEIVLWLMKSGYRAGFGCVGGHGRTGWLAAKLIKHFENCSGDEAVRRIRDRFCKDCVESERQVEDLGCKKTKSSDKVVTSSSWLAGYKPGEIKQYQPGTDNFNDWWDKHYGVGDKQSMLLPSYLKETGLDKVDKDDKDSPFIIHGD